jgi:hypothetical protein
MCPMSLRRDESLEWGRRVHIRIIATNILKMYLRRADKGQFFNMGVVANITFQMLSGLFRNTQTRESWHEV